ncbi:MAG: LLM class F420-dependent oxidoreductase [Alphaproteobacteria bacterium]|nr:LLM class F420-dependent oxidoreductase [Alphaproteobacteria bacterium]MCB9929957.1 LLM class F420-dependent oxidoreductase [Alphaproteobacteria bacterium]
MQVGVVFPAPEIAPDPGAIRDYAQTVEALGYRHLLTFDHVLGAGLSARPDWSGPYDHTHKFHEPLVLMGFLAAATRRLQLVTGIVILPQRQTALLAKQAAEVDVLSGGRLRLGVGIGWNAVEYEALNADFSTRGRRMEEQVEVLRQLWTRDLVTFEGQDHRIRDAGLNPLPVQRPIPLWGGAFRPVAIERVCRLMDGFFPRMPLDDKTEGRMERVWRYLEEFGRDKSRFGVDATVYCAGNDVDRWVADARRWQALGATHISIQTLGQGYTSWTQHLEALQRFREAWTGA